MHQSSNMLDLPMGIRERGRQYSQGSVLSSPPMARPRTDVPGPAIVEKMVIPVSHSLTPQTLPALPLAGLKMMANRWTLSLTCGSFPAHAHFMFHWGSAHAFKAISTWRRSCCNGQGLAPNKLRGNLACDQENLQE